MAEGNVKIGEHSDSGIMRGWLPAVKSRKFVSAASYVLAYLA